MPLETVKNKKAYVCCFHVLITHRSIRNLHNHVKLGYFRYYSIKLLVKCYARISAIPETEIWAGSARY